MHPAATSELSDVPLTCLTSADVEANTSTLDNRGNTLKTIAVVAFMSVLMSWVAIFNGAPLVFSDTMSYAVAALRREVPGMYSVFYSVLILPLHQGVSLWPVVFAQAAMMAHFLYLVVRCTSDGRIGTRHLLLIVAVLCIWTSLPWITGEILPDVFTPVVMLGTFLLVFCGDRLGRGEICYVVALTTIAITTHLSHVPIALGLLLLAPALQFLLGAKIRLRRIMLLGGILSVAIGSMLAVNWVNSGTPVFARNSNVFLLAKWIDEGPALAFLQKACKTEHHKLCAHLDELKGRTHDDLKWRPDSPFLKVGGFDVLESEAREIVRGTLRDHPFEILQKAFLDAGRQLLRFRTGDGLLPEYAHWVAGLLHSDFNPETALALSQSRQSQGRLPISEIRPLHLVAVIFGLIACIWTFARRAALPHHVVALQLFIVAGIVWNAIVTGGLSGPHDRYLARVIWLVLFVGILGLWCLARNPARGRV
jgi:hypothetical protein